MSLDDLHEKQLGKLQTEIARLEGELAVLKESKEYEIKNLTIDLNYWHKQYQTESGIADGLRKELAALKERVREAATILLKAKSACDYDIPMHPKEFVYDALKKLEVE